MGVIFSFPIEAVSLRKLSHEPRPFEEKRVLLAENKIHAMQAVSVQKATLCRMSKNSGVMFFIASHALSLSFLCPWMIFILKGRELLVRWNVNVCLNFPSDAGTQSLYYSGRFSQARGQYTATRLKLRPWPSAGLCTFTRRPWHLATGWGKHNGAKRATHSELKI